MQLRTLNSEFRLLKFDFSVIFYKKATMQILAPQPSMVDQVCEALLSAITAGKFSQDAHLTQEAIAESLGVSRQPVQQALLLLRSQGILTNAPGRGLMVAPLEEKRVRDLYEIREVLDGLASTKAARNASETARSEGPDYIKRGRAALANQSVPALVLADMEFHGFIYRLSGNPIIAETCAPHWSYFRCVMGNVLLAGEVTAEIWDQHEEMLEAIIAGNFTLAEERARHHISHSSEMVRANLKYAGE